MASYGIVNGLNLYIASGECEEDAIERLISALKRGEDAAPVAPIKRIGGAAMPDGVFDCAFFAAETRLDEPSLGRPELLSEDGEPGDSFRAAMRGERFMARLREREGGFDLLSLIDIREIAEGAALYDDIIERLVYMTEECSYDCGCGCGLGDRFTPPGYCGCDDPCALCGLCECHCRAFAEDTGCSVGVNREIDPITGRIEKSPRLRVDGK